MVYLRIFILLLCFLGLTQAGGPPPPIKGLKNKSDQSRNVTLSNKLFSHAQSKPPGALQARSLFGRQEECPPEYPELCPDLHCCEADTVCCDDGTCCDDAHPVCQSGTGLCCPTGTVLCDNVELCHEPDTICCEGGGSCYEDETCCGDACCSEDEACCGDACCPEVDDNGNPVKCCPMTENGPTCCGEYETCCDGYCCGEGATCASDGQCTLATLTWDDVADGLELCENTCLGIRSQLSNPGVYDISTQYQLLQYAGPGSGSATRAEGPCEGGDCCSGVGSTYQCDEYPYASTYEGGEGAWAACIDQAQNSHQGGVLSAFLSGMHDGFQFYVYVTGIDCDSVAKDALLPLNPQCPAQVVLPY